MQADIKLLDRVIGEKKELYLAILQHIAEGFTHEEVGLMVNLTRSRISQIYGANKQLCDELTFKAELATKAGRVRKIMRVINRKGDRSLSDVLDWMKLLRTELEGEKGINLSINTTANANVNNNILNLSDKELDDLADNIIQRRKANPN